ncbi:MAG: hypothetical protein ACRDGR_03540, partial [bacterium]
MIKNLGVLLGVAWVAALSVNSAHAAGPTPDGLQGLLRVHSAEPAAPGYLAGSLFGAYAQEWYAASESPRNRSEKVGFGGGFLSISYSPTPFVELAVRGTVESQFVDAY